MTDRPKRSWLPAFSIRTLLILMTILCAYAACWWPTKTQGVKDAARAHMMSLYGKDELWEGDADTVAPLLLTKEYFTLGEGGGDGAPVLRRRYYFWFFGFVSQLPYEPATPIEQHPWNGEFQKDEARFIESLEQQQKIRDSIDKDSLPAY